MDMTNYYEQKRGEKKDAAEARIRAQQAAREQDRADRLAEREEKRRDAEARAKREKQRKAERARVQQQRKDRRTAARKRAVAAITEHMPVAGIPVVAASLVAGWSGQYQAALHLGLGLVAPTVPLMTEGMTLTLAGLTAAAISAKRPHKRLLAYTWASAVFAAAFNAAGHLMEDSSPAGVYRAGAYAVASIAALVLWAVVMRSRRAEVSGRSAEELARWRRIRRRHPVISRRAARYADVTGRPFAEAFPVVWERAHGAGPAEPTVREIRSGRRSAYRRGVAQQWDGRRRTDAVLTSRTRYGKAPVLGEFVPVEMVTETRSETRSGTGSEEPQEAATTQFPTGRDAVSGDAENGSQNGAQGASGNGSGGRDWDALLPTAEEAARQLAAEAEKDKRKRAADGGISPWLLAKRVGISRKAGPELLKRLEHARVHEPHKILAVNGHAR